MCLAMALVVTFREVGGRVRATVDGHDPEIGRRAEELEGVRDELLDGVNQRRNLQSHELGEGKRRTYHRHFTRGVLEDRLVDDLHHGRDKEGRDGRRAELEEAVRKKEERNGGRREN